jgi:hypothetical protein
VPVGATALHDSNASATPTPSNARLRLLICQSPRSTEWPAAISRLAILTTPAPRSTCPEVSSCKVIVSRPLSWRAIATSIPGSSAGAQCSAIARATGMLSAVMTRHRGRRFGRGDAIPQSQVAGRQVVFYTRAAVAWTYTPSVS